MKIITGQYGGGKTKQLIEMASEKPGTCIICSSVEAADRIRDQARNTGLPVPYILTVKQLAKFLPTSVREVYFDDIEEILEALAGHAHVGAMTIPIRSQPTMRGENDD